MAFLSFIFGVVLTIILHYHFVRPVMTDRQERQAKRDVQARCEDEFATYPRQRGKELLEGIKKCRIVAGLNMEMKK